MPNQINKRGLLNTVLFLFVSFYSLAQIPAGYYNDADGKTGYVLKTSLYNVIKGHTDRGYTALWTLYKTSDKRADGFVWDIYSACDLEFDVDQDSGSGGTTECDKYNREHSFPKSWFNDGAPMINDPFHVIPTDKKVNSVRNNFAYGEVSNPSYTSLNGSKLGQNTIAGHSGTVFEPIDEYKGDVARGYLYMATRYENVITGWEKNDNDGDAMLNGTSDQVFEDWALAMLIDWHNADPVSQKEIDRNNAIYNYQNNRNPFIDHPEYVSSIWGGAASPVLNVTSSLIDFGAVAFGSVSDVQTYTVSGSNLTGNISIVSENGFEISLTDIDADFTTSLVIAHIAGTIANTTVFVRFKPLMDSNSTVTGSIVHTSSGSTTQILEVSGVEYYKVIPEINFSFSFRDINPTDQFDVQLYASEAPNDAITIYIEKTASTNLEYDVNYTTAPSLTNNVMEIVWPSGALSTTFSVNFDINLLDQVTPGSLTFSLNESVDYTNGTNNNFSLNLKGEVVSGVEETVNKLNVYPNPANEAIKIQWETGIFDYTITDLKGKRLLYGTSGQTQNIDVTSLKAGMYLLQLTNLKNSLTQRILIH